MRCSFYPKTARNTGIYRVTINLCLLVPDILNQFLSHFRTTGEENQIISVGSFWYIDTGSLVNLWVHFWKLFNRIPIPNRTHRRLKNEKSCRWASVISNMEFSESESSFLRLVLVHIHLWEFHRSLKLNILVFSIKYVDSRLL